MADIKLTEKGDLQLINLASQTKTVKDVALERNVTSLLLKRALLSPKGYITITELRDGQLFLKDSEYGNRVYEELSEGLTINFLSRVRGHVIEAINAANLNASVESVDVNIIDVAQTVQILIVYTNGTNSIIELNI